MGEHTKGEWREWSEEGQTPSGMYRHSVCIDRGLGGHTCVAEARGETPRQAYERARLIAAAPDLLAACEGAVEWLSGWASASPYIEQLQAALQKAKGTGDE